jgi:formylglycine-generating enzyme required for sulfatase activity
MKPLRRYVAWVSLAVSATLPSCEARVLPAQGQLLVYVDTDAPLPEPAGFPPRVDAPALFDRLSFELFLPGEREPCTGCSREIAPDRVASEGGRLSLGVLPPPGKKGLRARVRLYRSAGRPARAGSTVESVVLLPDAPETGELAVTVELRTADVARPRGSLDAPAPGAVRVGLPRPGFAGSFRLHERVGCKKPPEADEVCVPGGAFWMGNPRLDVGSANDFDGSLERLVVLSPFFLEKHETTVAEQRASGVRYLDDPSDRVTGKIAGCTYARDGSGPSDVPLNCISWTEARSSCMRRGRDLPTEAELEYVMGGLRGTSFPWGDDDPSCSDMIFGRDADGSSPCDPNASRPAPSGSGARDRLRLPSGELVDLSGNVSEWARDRFQLETEPCWGTGLFTDPFCDQNGIVVSGARSVRGGYFSGLAGTARAAHRSRTVNEKQAVAAEIGYRCARPDVP